MSQMDHKQTLRPEISMSALPRKRTFVRAIGMSALCQKRTHALQQLMPNLREAVPIANLPG